MTMPDDGPRYILIDALDEALLVPPGTTTIVDLAEVEGNFLYVAQTLETIERSQLDANRLDQFPPRLRVRRHSCGLQRSILEDDSPVENFVDHQSGGFAGDGSDFG